MGGGRGARLDPGFAEPYFGAQGGKSIKGFKNLYLTAKAKMWPRGQNVACLVCATFTRAARQSGDPSRNPGGALVITFSENLGTQLFTKAV